MAGKVSASVALLFVVLLAEVPYGKATSGAGFLSQDGARTLASGSVVTTEELKLSIYAAVDGMMGGFNSIIGAPRFSVIKASLRDTFQALPKNSLGRLSPRGVRYLVHSYFAKEHGWLIKGLEPHGNQGNISEMHDVTVLQDKAPALVEASLEARHSGQGLDLDDMVVMVATLERLIFDGSLDLLRVAYELNTYASYDRIHREALREVLVSYLVIYANGGRYNLSNLAAHYRTRDRVIARQDFIGYENDAVVNHDYMHRDALNPFETKPYTFTEASRIVNDLTQSYGKWQNGDCIEMKTHLLGMDRKGDGRIPLGVFYSQPPDANFAFSESVEYLRKSGILDESRPGVPQVLVANYINGPSNCVAHSSYYSVCCINECEAIMNELEAEVHAPRARPQRLLDVLANISTSTVEAPRSVPRALAKKLHAIARDGADGEVMIHGRLFAQWLHFAFPHECPYPTVLASASALSPAHWLGKSKSATEEERERYVQVEQGAGASAAAQGASDHASAPVANTTDFAAWNDDEVLILSEPDILLGAGEPSSARELLRCITQLVLGAALLSVVAFSVGTAFEARTDGQKLRRRPASPGGHGFRTDKKDDDRMIPMDPCDAYTV